MSHLDRHRPPPALRLAGRIHELLLARPANRAAHLLDPLSRLAHQMEQLDLLRRRIAIAQAKGWRLAQSQLLNELRCLLNYLPGEAQAAERALPVPIHMLSFAELIQEFEQIEAEFGGWGYERPGILTVATEPITLEEMPLGAFEIRLNLESLGMGRHDPPYELLARAPNPASCNESITHPHIRDGQLCEGDAASPIKAALAEGRLCDFFMLVRSVLQTYNPHSPHVALENWHGSSCHDCSSLMNDDERSYCEACDHDFCESCISYCRCCDETQCLNCLENCPRCEERTCNDCMEVCLGCARTCCRSCLNEGICPGCQDKKDPQDAQNNQNKEKSHDNRNSILEPAIARTGCDASIQGGVGATRSTGHLSIRARRRRRHRIPQAA